MLCVRVCVRAHARTVTGVVRTKVKRTDTDLLDGHMYVSNHSRLRIQKRYFSSVF